MPTAHQLIEHLKDRVATAERTVTNYEAEIAFLRTENKRLQIENTLLLERVGKLDIRQELARDIVIANLQRNGMRRMDSLERFAEEIGPLADMILGLGMTPPDEKAKPKPKKKRTAKPRAS